MRDFGEDALFIRDETAELVLARKRQLGVMGPGRVFQHIERGQLRGYKVKGFFGGIWRTLQEHEVTA